MMDTRLRALDAARRGRHALRQLETRDAAWLGLYSLELDPECALGWALVAHILTEAARDPAGTWVSHYALGLGLPEPDRTEVARYHRIDLWTRGLVAHVSGRAVIEGREVDDEAAFRSTPRLDPWLDEQTRSWDGTQGILRAVLRMVAALADAWEVPAGGNALRGDAVWPKKPAFAEWCEADPLQAPAPTFPTAATPVAQGLKVLSDYWIRQEIAELGAQGAFDAALERAKTWARLRPNSVLPQVALTRLHHARDDHAARDAVAGKLSTFGEASLEDLEEARLALGELKLWAPQVELLDRMERLAPEHPTILTNRGVAKLELDDEAGATADLQAAIEVAPDSAPALANLALVHLRKDEYVAAQDLLQRALAVAPDEPDVLVYLAVCKNNQDDPEAALTDLRRALEIAPDHAQAQRLLAELEAG